MSHFTGVKSDIPRGACRPGSSRRATSEVFHVAQPARERRHCLATMSLEARVKSDMGRRPCRSTCSPQATWVVDHVAQPAHPKRHASSIMSPDPIVKSDMSDRALAHARPGGATFTRAWVASPERGMRHGQAGVFACALYCPPQKPRNRSRRRGRGRSREGISMVQASEDGGRGQLTGRRCSSRREPAGGWVRRPRCGRPW